MAEDNAEDARVSGLAWFLAGLGVGALVGVLYAPKSGREARVYIANNARQGKEYLRSRSKQATERVGTLVGRGKEQVSQYIDRGQTQWRGFVERGKNLVGQRQSRAAAAVEAGRQDSQAPEDGHVRESLKNSPA
jgi:gas vesicle protein